MEKRGRPRRFDREVALRRAMEVFWEKGFEDASMTDLTQAMGIASPSLYAAFGSKEELFQEAVALYQARFGGRMWDALDREPVIVAALEAFLMETARAYSRRGVPRGCLIVLGARHASAAGDPVCDELKRRRAENLTRLRARFARAIAEGELPQGFDCDAAAAFYATLQHGMSLMARDGADAATLQAIAAGGLRAFTGPGFADPRSG